MRLLLGGATKPSKRAGGVLAAVIGLLLPVSSAFAATTAIDTVVSGNQASVLHVTQVTTGRNGTAVTTPPPASSNEVILTMFAWFFIRGGVNNLIQMDVFVDGNYSSTIPLTTSDSSFRYAVELTPGTHTITLKGISADGSANPTSSLRVDYEPNGVFPSSGSTPTSPSNTATAQPSPAPGGGVFIGKPLSSSVTGASEGEVMPSWLYASLVTLNIITPGSSSAVAYSNLWRILLLLAALVVIIWARALVAMARTMVKKDGLPRYHPVAIVRVIAVLVIILIFLFP